MTAAPVIGADSLRVSLPTSGRVIVDDVSLKANTGEILGVVGESGSGKTTTVLTLLAHTRRGARIDSGRVMLGGRDLLSLGRRALRDARGGVISYVPQDPSTALNPALRIGTQLREVVDAHPGRSGASADARITRVLAEVSLPSDRGFLRRFPHELSGGQQQRIAIALALVTDPAVVVFDEPTTGLDVTTQAHVLRTIKQLCRDHAVAAVYVSHDLAVVAELADRIAVMRHGAIVEQGTVEALLTTPAHPYTRELVAAVPRLTLDGGDHAPAAAEGGDALVREPELRHRPGSERSPVLAVRGLAADHGTAPALRDIELQVWPDECVALVGASGSGKTTLARTVAGLHPPSSGAVVLHGIALAPRARARSAQARRAIQYVFQDPYASLNPRRSVGDAIARQLALFEVVPRRERASRTRALLEAVALSPKLAAARPGELSGGERQRVAIARALAAEPELLICDEITASLDVSVQAKVVDLLRELRQERDLGLLFIAHDLALVQAVADRVAVLDAGRVVESGPVDSVFASPSSVVTVRLLRDAPRLRFPEPHPVRHDVHHAPPTQRSHDEDPR